MGGALSIASGVLVPEIDAVVAFYGTPSSELADPSKSKAPVQAHFGELDSFVGFSDITVWSPLTDTFKKKKFQQKKEKEKNKDLVKIENWFISYLRSLKILQ